MSRAVRPGEAVLILALVALGFGLAPWLSRMQPPSPWVIWRWWHARSDATQCMRNMMQIGTALEMYTTENDGRFPVELNRLVPKYLPEIPTCPAAADDTYSRSFASASKPDAWTFTCSGWHHANVGFAANHPQHTSVNGAGPLHRWEW